MEILGLVLRCGSTLRSIVTKSTVAFYSTSLGMIDLPLHKFHSTMKVMACIDFNSSEGVAQLFLNIWLIDAIITYIGWEEAIKNISL